MICRSRSLKLLCIVLLSIVVFGWLTAHIFNGHGSWARFQQNDPDSVLFARLLEKSLLKGEAVESDRYGCFPYEIRHGLPPFYLQFLLQFIWLVFAVFPSCPVDPVALAGFLPVVFAWLTWVMILGALWFLTGNFRLLLFSAFFMLPGKAAGMTSGFMKLDYDFLISFFIWIWLLAGALHIHKKLPAFKIAAGIITGLLLGTWSGTPLFFFLTTVYGFCIWLARREETADYLAFSSSSLLIGGGLNLLWLLISPEMAEKISLSKYSYFQPLCIIAGGLFHYSLQILGRFKRPVISGFLIMAVLAGGAWLAFDEQILQATGLLLQKDPVHGTITELAPAVDFGNFTRPDEILSELLAYYCWPVFFLPFFLFVRPYGFKDGSGRLLLDWLMVMILLSMHQIRFLRWPGIGLGLYAGMVANHLWHELSSRFRAGNLGNLKLAAVFLPLLLSFSLIGFTGVTSNQALRPFLSEAFAWIARNTPPTSGHTDDNKPEYGILSLWDEGNLLSYYARRPAVVNNAMWGYKTMADIFSSTTEDEAFALCRKYGVKYIYLSTYRKFNEKSFVFWPYFKNLPEKPEYRLLYQDVPSVSGYEGWFYFWLFDHLALTPAAEFGAGTRFRVVYAAEADQKTLPPCFLFERVEGAGLNLTVDPGSELSISLELGIGKHRFIYKTRKIAGSDGSVSLLLPYSTTYTGGRVSSEGFYKLRFQRLGRAVKAKLHVPEDCVVNGGALNLDRALEMLPETR